MKILTSLIILVSLNAQSETKSVFDRHAAEKVMSKNRKKFEKCFSSEIKKDPDYREGVILHLNISPKGLVQKFAITDSTTNNPKLHACLGETLQALKFYKRGNGPQGTLIYPMILTRRDCEN